MWGGGGGAGSSGRYDDRTAFISRPRWTSDSRVLQISLGPLGERLHRTRFPPVLSTAAKLQRVRWQHLRCHQSAAGKKPTNPKHESFMDAQKYHRGLNVFWYFFVSRLRSNWRKTRPSDVSRNYRKRDQSSTTTSWRIYYSCLFYVSISKLGFFSVSMRKSSSTDCVSQLLDVDWHEPGRWPEVEAFTNIRCEVRLRVKNNSPHFCQTYYFYIFSSYLINFF